MGLPESAIVRFGRYRLVERLGAGGMAVVYKAIVDGPKGFARPLVIKRILPIFLRDQSFVNMLLTEARLSAMLRHPAIVQVLELGEVDGEYFMAMEYIDGHDLSTVRKKATEQRQHIPPAVAVYIVSELLSALAYAHSLSDDQGRAIEIVHRDVSPSNVMVTSNGGVKLLDFGIAKAANHMRSDRTRTSTVKGKLSYLSPEQAEGLFVDKRTDIFALGIVLHECLTMKQLFRGRGDFEIMRLVREAKVAPPSTLAPDIPPELDAVVLKMLARDATERYQTCEEALDELRPVLHELHADAGALTRFLQALGPFECCSQPVDETDAPLVPGGKAATSWALRAFASARGTVRWVGGVGAVAAVAVAVAVAIVIASGSKARREPLPAVAVPEPSLVAPTPVDPVKPGPGPRVHLVVLGTEGAEVLLDGNLLGRVPLDQDLPKVRGSRRLIVHLSAHQPLLKEVDGEKDTTITARLRRTSVPLRRPTAAVQRKPPTKSVKVEIKDPF